MAITQEAKAKKLKELLSGDRAFLTKLAEVGRLTGWNNDYVEVRQFIEDCHREAGVEVPNLDPYETTIEDD